jgi:formate hydrogenlyase transcriptional activator
VEIQPKLLRALQEREFERLGSTHTKKVNVRLVGATNRDLKKMIEDRQFRSDLYYRLNVFPIRIPPLRERPGDIPLLVRYFAEKFSRQMQKPIESIPAATMETLVAWHWPGNIRELENLIERSVILTSGKALQVPLAELEKPATNGASNALSATTWKARSANTSSKCCARRMACWLKEWRGQPVGAEKNHAAVQDEKAGITRDHWWPSAPA